MLLLGYLFVLVCVLAFVALGIIGLAALGSLFVTAVFRSIAQLLFAGFWLLCAVVLIFAVF